MRIKDFGDVLTLVGARDTLQLRKASKNITVSIDGVEIIEMGEALRPVINAEIERRICAIDQRLAELGVRLD